MIKSQFRGEYSIDHTVNESRRLAEIIKNKYNYIPDKIISILGGGLLPGTEISNEMGIDNIQVKIGRNIDTTEVHKKYHKWLAKLYHEYLFLKTKPEILSDISFSVEGKKILIIDDVIHTGSTFEIIKAELYKRGANDVRIGTLSYVRENKKPDFSLYKGRIRLPWSMNSKYFNEYQNLLKNNSIKSGKNLIIT